MLTLLANGHREPLPIGVAIDLCNFYEATGRTIPQSKWATDLTEAEQSAMSADLDLGLMP